MDHRHKIVSEFSLVPEGKQKLQEFFDERFSELRSEVPLIRERAQSDLVELIRGNPEGTGVFPKQALDELRLIVTGRSDLALLLTNCPERLDLEKTHEPAPEECYGYHLGQALYQMHKIDLIRTESLYRQSHKAKAPEDRHVIHPGAFLPHRDMLTANPESDVSEGSRSAEYIVFCSPYNGENSLTDIIDMKRAIASIPQETREKTQVKAMFVNDKSEWMNLNQVLALLSNHPNTVGDHAVHPVINAIEVPEDGFNAGLLEHAIHTCSESINMQPGNLLFVDEKQMFHQGGSGRGCDIIKIPQDNMHSRVFYHIAGAPSL